MMHADDDEVELMGPGVDLAMSLSGILIIVVFVTVTQLWISNANHSDLAAAVTMQTNETQNSNRAALESAELKAKTAEAKIGSLENKIRARNAELDTVQNELTNSRMIALGQRKLLEQTKNELKNIVSLLNSAKVRSNELQVGIDSLSIDLAKMAASLRTEQEKRQVAEAKYNAAARQIVSLTNEIYIARQKSNDKPPLITISDETFRTFQEGSAEVSLELRRYLSSIVKTLYDNRTKYGANVIEVVGHTDEVRLGPSKRQQCNLDLSLLDVLHARKNTTALGPCDNVGLGMARAAAVIDELNNLGLRNNFTILPLSAGAAIDTNGTMADSSQVVVPIPARRRIEIRMRRGDE